jgi:hypothetical protein
MAVQGGVDIFDEAFGVEFGRYGITVKLILPGYNHVGYVLRTDPRKEKQLIGQILQGKVGDPKDIGNGVLFFASEYGTSAPVNARTLTAACIWISHRLMEVFRFLFKIFNKKGVNKYDCEENHMPVIGSNDDTVIPACSGNNSSTAPSQTAPASSKRRFLPAAQTTAPTFTFKLSSPQL